MRRIFVIALLAIFATIIIVATASMFSEDFRAQMTDLLGVPGEMIAEQMISLSTWASLSATNSTIQACIWGGIFLLLGIAVTLLWKRRPAFLGNRPAQTIDRQMRLSHDTGTAPITRETTRPSTSNVNQPNEETKEAT